jgi:hypothetical protein
VVTAKQISPGQAHLEMVPIYGIRYENASDKGLLPGSEGYCISDAWVIGRSYGLSYI